MSSFVNDIPLEISHNDDRLYRHITLSNKLEVMIISDPTTEKAACCCDVRVGAFADPDEFPGLAHFLEHLLFMGTESYPGENYYSAFLSSHGGYSNAYTSLENTVYYFDVTSGHLDEGLAIFAAFFTCPLFAEESTSREMNAVDSENSKNLQNDAWKSFQLLKHLSKTSHPFNKFSTGNLATLGGDKNSRSACIDFHKKFYSANIMKVCIYGKESLDELQVMAEKHFSDVKNLDLNPADAVDVPPDAFGPEQLGRFVQMVPVSDLKTVELHWPIPACKHLYKTKSHRYLSHLLGHESEGSVLSALKEKNLANECYAGVGENFDTFATISFVIELTDLGVEQVDDVITCCFAYIGMLQQEGAQLWISKEMQDTATMNFRYKSKIKPDRYVTRVANNMHHHAIEHTLSGEELIFEDCHLEAQQVIQCLTPENALIFLKNKKFVGKTSEKEPWYGTEYNINTFDSKTQLDPWKAAMSAGKTHSDWGSLVHLPKVNEFMPTDFSLRFSEEDCNNEELKSYWKHPKVIEVVSSGIFNNIDDSKVNAFISDRIEAIKASNEDEKESDTLTTDTGDVEMPPGMATLANTTWYRPDLQWKVPKCNVKIQFSNYAVAISAQGVALTDMFIEVLKEILVDYTYYASCANVDFSISTTAAGFELHLGGYSHKMPILARRICEEMKSIADPSKRASKVSQELWERCKEKKATEYQNFAYSQPYYHCITASAICLEEPRWHAMEKLRALQQCDLIDLFSFAKQLMNSTYTETLIYGNMSEEESKTLSNTITTSLDLSPMLMTELKSRRVVKLEKNKEYVYRQHCCMMNEDEPNSAIENVYFLDTEASIDFNSAQTMQDIIHLEAMTAFIGHLLSEPCFNQLRTMEQLGYITHASSCKFEYKDAIRIIVQSSVKSADYLDERIELFLKQFEVEELNGKLKDETEFQNNIQSFIELLNEKPKNTTAEFSRIWAEISNSRYNFDAREAKVACVEQFTLEDVLIFWKKYIRFDAPNRKKFSSQFYGKSNAYPDRKPDVYEYLPPVAEGERATNGTEKLGSRVYISNPTHFKSTATLYQCPYADFSRIEKYCK